MRNYIPVKILLVEDNPTDAELTIRAFKKQRLANEFFVAEDGEEALDFLFNHARPDYHDPSKTLKVILLDLKLPKLDGMQVLAEIKAHPETRMIPVVIITSSREDPDIKKAYELGANSYVVKPVDFESFVSAMQNTGLYWLLVNEIPKQ